MSKYVPRFWREIQPRYNLKGNKCGSCERVYFPPRESCPYCRRKSIGNMHQLQLSGHGEVISYAIIHVGPEDFEEQVPYPIAVIQLDEGPRLTAQIVDCPIDHIHIGMRVKSVFRKIQEDGSTGAIYYGYKFCKCNDINTEKREMETETVANTL